MKKKIAIIAGVVGIVFVALGAYYWVTPAGSLPGYLPGFAAGSAHVHFKHGLASFILGLGLFAYAWFASAPSKKPFVAETVSGDQQSTEQQNG